MRPVTGLTSLDAGVAMPSTRHSSEQPDDVDDESELEELQALEEENLDTPPSLWGDLKLRTALNQLGTGSFVHDRLSLALDAATWTGAELPFELGLVADPSTFDVSLVRDRYDIPVEMHPLVAQYIRFFQGAGRKWFRRWMSRSTRYIPLMQPILESKGLPRDTVYLAMIESGFSTQAKSWAKAVGPWQFIPGTAKWFRLKEDYWVDERRDPIKATVAAANYLQLLYSTLGHWYLAWAGYNTGGGRVRMLIDRTGRRDFWELAQVKRGFAKETIHYVPKLIACALVARHPESFGFSSDEFEPEGPFEFDEIPLAESVDLDVVAQSAGATVEEIRVLNPELKRWCTPPATAEAPYLVRIPKGRKPQFDEAFAKYSPEEKLNYRIHRVSPGDTLSRIAARYHSAQEAIMRMNGLSSARSLRLGTELVVPVPSVAALRTGRVDVALDRQVARARRAGLKAARPEEEIPAAVAPSASRGRLTSSGSVTQEQVDGKTRVTYGVARGDNLWTIARRFDVRVADLKAWNDFLASNRIRAGLALTIWPGARADLSSGALASAAPAPTSATSDVSMAPPSSPATAEGELSSKRKAAPVTPAAKGTKHTVLSGDSLWSIAQQYGTSVNELKSWNGLTRNKLKLGQVLSVAPP
jgi:membrane-bound lytic murein transglycosylase D